MEKNSIGECERKEDEEKEKWWAEERNIFHGRVNAFLVVMNDIQSYASPLTKFFFNMIYSFWIQIKEKVDSEFKANYVPLFDASVTTVL